MEPTMGPKMGPGSSPKWAQRGPQNGAENGPKMCPKRTKNGAQNWPALGPENGQTAAEFSCCVFENLATNQARIQAQKNSPKRGPIVDMGTQFLNVAAQLVDSGFLCFRFGHMFYI